MEISIYSTIDFSKSRNLLTDRQKNIKAFNPIVPQGGCISLMELNPYEYTSIAWTFINEITGKRTITTATSSDGMHYVDMVDTLRLDTYRLEVKTERINGLSEVVTVTVLSNPFEYVKASGDVVTLVSSNVENDLVGNIPPNATIIQPIYENPPAGETGRMPFSGFVNRVDSAIALTGPVFEISPTGANYEIYVGGDLFTISTTKTVTLPTDKTLYFIYFDANGDLQYSSTPWNITSFLVIPCAIVFRESATVLTLTDERHSYSRNIQWHEWAHHNIGTMYYSGLEGTFTDTALSVAQGVIYDEDIKFDTLTTKTTCSLWHRDGVNPTMTLSRNSSTPFSESVGGDLQYDNNGVLEAVGNNKYIASWAYCSNDPEEPIYVVIGQVQSNSISTIRSLTSPIINLETAEWKLLYKVIYRSSGGTAAYIEKEDYRRVQTGVATSVPTGTSHSSLVDRDALNSHQGAAIGLDTTNFDNNLSAADDTVQKAMETLDELVSGGTSDVAQTITYAVTVIPNIALGNIITITLTGDITISNPINITGLTKIEFIFIQGGTGGYTASFGTAFKQVIAPELGGGIGDKNYVEYYAYSSSDIVLKNVIDL